MRGACWWRRARGSGTFLKPCNIWRKWHCHSPQRSTACHLGSRKWPPHQARYCGHPLETQVFCRWAEPYRCTWGRRSLGRPSFDQWCRCISCGPAACIASTRLSCCRHHCDTQHRGTCRISRGYQEKHRMSSRNLKRLRKWISVSCQSTTYKHRVCLWLALVLFLYHYCEIVEIYLAEPLTHWGLLMHVCIFIQLVFVCIVRDQPIALINAELLSLGRWITNCSSN